MRANKLDINGTKTVSNCHNQAMIIALDIENHPIVTNNARTPILILYVLGNLPFGRYRLVIPCL